MLLTADRCGKAGIEPKRSFMDYAMTTAANLPPFFAIRSALTPTKTHPDRSQGHVEEGVTVGAVNNAVNDALAPFEAVLKRQTLTPPAIFALLARR